jgi:phage minor structural protein
MYEIYVCLNPSDPSNKVLWAPGLEDHNYILYSAILELELNHSGKLTFQMSPKHPLYGQLQKRKSIVTVIRNGSEVWRGRVLDSKKDFYKRKTVVCEGALSYLLDVTVRPYTFNGTIKEYFRHILTLYNMDCDDDKRFGLGDVTAVDLNTEISITEQSSLEYPSVLDEFNDKIVSKYGGYLRVRRVTDGFYRHLFRLDYLSTSGSTINQKIEFGKNLLDLEDYITSENVCTRCIPLGATLREIEDFKKYLDPTYVSTLKDEDGDKRLDITSINSGKDYIEHNEGISLFGRVTKCIVFDNIVTAESLLTTAQEWLNTNVAMNTSMEIKAIDLSLVADDVDAIDYGTSVEVISPPHDTDMFMICSSLKINILSPAETDYIFGAGFSSMTDQQAKALKQSAKAFNSAKSANTSVRNIAVSVAGQYLSASEFNAFKDQLDRALDQIDTLPEATTLDNGKVLKIIGGKWVKADDDVGEAELPDITDEDDGKVLKIIGGQWVKADDNVGEAELPEITDEDDGKVLKIIGGQWVKADDNVGEAELPPVTEENEGMILKVVGGKWTAVAVE